MKSNSGTFGSIVLAILLAFSLFLIAQDSLAQDTEPIESDGKIEVDYPAKAQAPYRERRQDWSVVFGANVDQIYPDQFRSPLTSDSYDALFGEAPISLVQVQLGAKYNFSLGGIGLAGFVGHGSIQDARYGESRELSLLKKGVSAHLILDNLWDEPYVAPYIEGQIYNFDWSETGIESEGLPDIADSTALSSAIQVGLLFQLNWLDPDAAIQSQNSSGLENVYLDLFVSQYNTSDDENDPNFETATNFGAGLKLEF